MKTNFFLVRRDENNHMNAERICPTKVSTRLAGLTWTGPEIRIPKQFCSNFDVKNVDVIVLRACLYDSGEPGCPYIPGSRLAYKLLLLSQLRWYGDRGIPVEAAEIPGRRDTFFFHINAISRFTGINLNELRMLVLWILYSKWLTCAHDQGHQTHQKRKRKKTIFVGTKVCSW